MEHTSRALVLAVVLCAGVLITPGAAHGQPPQPESPPAAFPIDIEKCWSALFNVNGCVLELFQSILTGKFGNVGLACCKAYSNIDANCWPHMFPLNPFFPPLLKDSCAHMVPILPKHK